MENVYVRPSEVWQYYITELSYTDNIVLIAENEEYGVEIYLSDDAGTAVITVEQDGYQLDEDCAVTELDCTDKVKGFYDLYLNQSVFEIVSDEPVSYCEDYHEMMIERREGELDDAFTELLETVLSGTDYDPDTVLEDIKEHTLEYLARKYGVRIRRPMFLDAGDREIYEEYPYSCIVFEDDNPIYAAVTD